MKIFNKISNKNNITIDIVKERTIELVKKNKELEQKNKDLEEFNDLFIGREFRIKELKNKVIELGGIL